MHIFRLILLFYIFFNSHVFSQSGVWIKPKAEWHIGFNAFISGGFIKTRYVGDEQVGNRIWQKLESRRYSFTMSGPGQVVFLDSMDTWSDYTSVAGDTVFYYTYGEHVLYNFGAQPGDSWDLGLDTNNVYCSRSIVHVDSVGTEVISGVSMRWISVHTDPNSSLVMNGKIYERFGCMNGGIFPLNNFCDTSIIVDSEGRGLLCYSDSLFSLYNATNVPCDAPLNIASSNSSAELGIYPNPVSDYIYIHSNVNGTWSLYSSTGKFVFTSGISSDEQIDLTFLPSGVYFIQVYSSNLMSTHKVIKL